MTDILLIRHGETAWNAVRKLQGHLDIPLNAEGRRQAKALAAGLQHEKLAAIISSDLQRAMQTAGEIARLQGLPTRIDAALRERCFGDFEGKLYSELPEMYPQEYAHWRQRDPDFHFPPKPDDSNNRGESIREFHQRTIDSIVHHAQQFEGKKIALVAHGGVLECAYREAMNLPLNAERTITIYNASINRFVYQDGQLSLVSWGDIEHLGDLALDELAEVAK
ncbi:histidine phosphatase family protein [Undibacterium seohonense]|uniref:Histidine phosphatase family protein n=1 Tax=Undibacterium seohonense TaxID=1344950 RepID=A0ABR6X1W4_9BURK|nr:histidine phosphatase family protein [Undibacterium seohonense]